MALYLCLCVFALSHELVGNFNGMSRTLYGDLVSVWMLWSLKIKDCISRAYLFSFF